MKKTKSVDLIFDKLQIPFVEFELSDGTSGRAIIDTGSESSLFDVRFVKDHKKCFNIKKTNEKVDSYGLMGTKKDERIIHIDSTLWFKEKDIEVGIENAMLSDLSFVNESIKAVHGKENMVQALLGCDWLRDKHIKINFKTDKMEF